MQQFKIHSMTVGPIATNCYLIEIEAHMGIIIDPGADAPAIIARIEALKIVPRYILCTHGHFDHILAIPDIRDHYEKKQIQVEIVIHSMDKDYVGRNALIRHRRDLAGVGGLAFLERFPKQFPEASRIVDEGDRVGPFTVLHLPGHTPGSVAYLDEQRGIIFTGDTLFAGGVGRTDLPGGDEIALQASLRRLYGLPGSTKVYSGHGRDTRIERERPRYP